MVFRLPDNGPVRVRTSATPADTPTAAELEEGEIALNTADGVLYYQTAAGVIGTAGRPDAPSDGITYGRKDAAWVDITSPANLQVRRGDASEVAQEVLLDGEPAWASDSKLLYVGDGETAGGVPVGGLDLVTGNILNGARVRLANGVAGGTAPNALGIGSVDLQTTRSAATQVAGGQYGFAAGRNNTIAATATDSFIFGRGVTASEPYSMVHGFAIGQVVASRVAYFLVATTTDATPTAMANPASALAIRVPEDHMLSGTLRVSAYVYQTAASYAFYERRVVALNIGGTTTVPVAADVATEEDTAAWDLTVAADDANDLAKVTVTGEAATTIVWIGHFEGLLTNIAGA